MTQNEFFERTKVNLTPEEYSRVESLYMAVKMNKDLFCMEWMKMRKNQLMTELGEGVKSLNTELVEKEQETRELKKRIVKLQQDHAEDMKLVNSQHNKATDELLSKIICAGENSKMIYDIVEEEKGIAFIIKTKRQNGIALTEDEIDYMVNKL